MCVLCMSAVYMYMCIHVHVYVLCDSLDRFAFVEFSSPDSVPIALQYNGAMFGDRPVK